MSMRTHYCAEGNDSLVGSTISVAGWVNRRRDHGGVVFVGRGDREGLRRVVFAPSSATLCGEAERLRNAWVIRVTGNLRPRPAGTANANLPSGQVELVASDLEVLNR